MSGNISDQKFQQRQPQRQPQRQVIVWALLASAVALSCSGSNKKKDISEPPLRAGTELSKTEAVYTDHKPRLSSDGTKVVFISGRTRVNDRAVMKIFKSTWAAGATPSTPSKPVRLTNDNEPSETTVEIDSALSPNGNWVAVIGVTESQTDLWLVQFSNGTALRVTNDDVVESVPSFSPDGNLLSWMALDPETSARNIKVVDVSAAPAALPTVYSLTKDEDGIERAGFWSTADTAPYVYTTWSGVEGKPSVSRFDRRSFATAAAAPSATVTTWLTEFSADYTTDAVAAADDKAILVRRVLPSEKLSVGQTGDLVEEEDDKAERSVESTVTFAAYSASEATELTKRSGFKILSVDIPKGGDAGFWVEREVYRCIENDSVKQGAALTVGPADLSDAKHYLPLTGVKDGTWEVSDNLCNDKRADKSVGIIDNKMIDASVASAGNATSFRVAYVTQFSKTFDVNCLRKAGDTEVLLMDIQADQKNIYALSNNPAPLKDDERATPCE